MCPITSKIKGYPFEVLLPTGLQTTGVILVDQIKSIDWQDRGATYAEDLPQATLLQVLELLRRFLF